MCERVLMHRMGRLLLFLVLLTSIISTGCVRKFKLNLEAGSCLNPPDLYCDKDGTGSRVLEVQVYQLKQWLDPATLNWEDFLIEGRGYDTMRSYLTDADRKNMVVSKFTIQRKEEFQHKIYKLPGTRYLLIVAAGRNRGNSSILLVPLHFMQRKEKLVFDYYDVKAPSLKQEVMTNSPTQPSGAIE